MKLSYSYTNTEMEEIINEYIHSERDRLVMRMVFIDGLSHERIGEKVNLSTRQVSNVISKHSIIIADVLERRKRYDVTGLFSNLQELGC